MKHISTQLVSWVLILPSIECTLTKQWVSIQNNDNINYVINVLTRNSLFVNVDLINSIHSASNSGALSSDSDWWWSSCSAGCGSRGSASSFVGSDGLIAFFCFGFPSERILRGLLLLEIQWAMAGLGSNDFMSHLIRLTLMRSWERFLWKPGSKFVFACFHETKAPFHNSCATRNCQGNVDDTHYVGHF